jgi:hypothetical protein
VERNLGQISNLGTFERCYWQEKERRRDYFDALRLPEGRDWVQATNEVSEANSPAFTLVNASFDRIPFR